ncbi:MAG: cupin-like domain-containing protein [Methylotenera sp.]|nr:cupin-like domain-containing protein [Oligoflexia bacterium]
MTQQTWIQLPEKRFESEELAPVQHGLSNHPLLQMDELLNLALRMPADQVRFYSGSQVPITQSLETVAERFSNGMTLADTMKHMDTAGSYVFLGQVQTDPVYKALVDEVLDQIEPMIIAQTPGLKKGNRLERREGWIFISSPGAVTPYHRDHETNFLCQVRGKKTVHVWDARDREVCSESENETFHGAHTLKATIYRPELEAKARIFELRAGDGAYMPYTNPHWVKNGDEVSISLSVTYHTAVTDRIRNLYRVNHTLRNKGYQPEVVGRSPMLDALKYASYESFKRAKRLLKDDPHYRTTAYT